MNKYNELKLKIYELYENNYMTEKSKSDFNYKKYEINDSEVKEYLENDSYLKKYISYLSKNTGEIIIDKDRGSVIGYVFVGKNKDKGFISTLEVKPKYRRCGFGTTLLKDAVNKYNAIDLLVLKSNKKAISLYEKNGFEVVDNNQTYEGQPALWMKIKKKSTK